MIPTKTYPLSAIIGDEVDDYERGYAQGCEEGRERIAELEAQLKHAEGHAAELEAEVMAWRERLGLAVAALKSIDLHSWDRDTQKLAAETIAQIEEGK